MLCFEAVFMFGVMDALALRCFDAQRGECFL